MSIKMSKVGHLVLRVRDLRLSLDFYERLLAMREVARRDFGEGQMAFLSTVNSHHDIALVETGDTAPRGAVLHHFALKVGDSLSELRGVRTTLEEAGVEIHMALDHRVSQGLYISDPDGNLIELYVDSPGLLWRDDPSLVANSDPLVL